MREILFRGKTNKGKWEYGSLNVLPNGDYQIASCCTNPPDSDPLWKRILITHKVIPETVGQYTGVKDRNGKKIFEGDIVLIPAHPRGKHKAIVYFKDGKFAVDGSNHSFKNIISNLTEVIGNIYDEEGLNG